MPTAAAFRAAAAAVTTQHGLISPLSTSLQGLVGATGMMGNGPPRRADDDLDEAARLTGIAIIAIEELIDELNRRADVCEKYDNDMNRYRKRWDRYVSDLQAGLPATRPYRPDLPAPWVSES